MPNWCNNNIELAHENPEMVKRALTAFTDGRLLDEFIPLPLKGILILEKENKNNV
jgi:hypothetical protein